MLCFPCALARAQPMILHSTKSETAFTIGGFCNLKKGKEKFIKHKKSDLHRESVMKIAACRQLLVDAQLSKAKEKEQKEAYAALKEIVTLILFLERQGLAVRGHDSDEGNFQELLRLRAKEIPELKKWLTETKKHYTTSDIQNELLQIMTHEILRDVTLTV